MPSLLAKSNPISKYIYKYPVHKGMPETPLIVSFCCSKDNKLKLQLLLKLNARDSRIAERRVAN
ncbi:MAG: hypothetical protein CMM54_06565 [Rhodospirillaceae bacterium]|nr:hypothetical protein [Rhodospirillaceae bacterium]